MWQPINWEVSNFDANFFYKKVLFFHPGVYNTVSLMNCMNCCCTKIAYYLLCIGVSLVSRHSVEKSAVNGSLILAILYRIFLKHFIGTRVKIVHQRLKRYLKVIFITRSVTSQRIWSVQSLKNMNWFKIASNISHKKELIKIKIAQLSTTLQDSYFYITVDLC